jgi:ATP-binding cassette, subfamily B, bacterial PglK
MAAAAVEEVKVTPPAATAPGVLKQVWAILSPEERRRFLWLQPLVVVTALIETAGLASIVPFLALLSDPAAIERHPALKLGYEALGFNSTTSFFFAVGVAVLAVITVGNAANALTTWALLRFAWQTNHTFSIRLLEAYLRRPYSYFLERNVAELSKNLLAEVNAVVGGVLGVLTQLVSRTAVMLGVLVTLLWIDPVMALGTGGVFGGLYGAMFAVVRNQLRRDGAARNAANAARHKIASEALGGVKELKLYGLEAAAVEAYGAPSLSFAVTQARAAVIGQIPRYGLETIAFGGVLVIVLGLLWRGQGLNEVLPVLGLYAFAAYRMLPGLQTIFNGMTSLRFSQPALDTLYRDLHVESLAPAKVSTKIHFDEKITLDDVGFVYAGAGSVALSAVSISISRGEWVALVGRTGAGKSTLVDILLGLLHPTSGSLHVDGCRIDPSSVADWQCHLAYVPQQIFFTDDTIEKNICFGVPADRIDHGRMRQAARVAQLASFIENELPHGYQTRIGDRGIRMSGGQRQRLGIARALYRQPRLIVLDEATSALDNSTEAAFFAALRSELSDVCVVSIAHRLSTTRGFDRILVMEAGRITDAGAFEELRRRNPHFAGDEVGAAVGEV